MTKIPRSSGPGQARGGFSLVELLVVIAILAILASLTTAGIQKARSWAKRSNTNTAVAKFESGVDLQLKAINDQVALDASRRTGEFQQLFAYCDGDLDRAKALLTYCRVKQAFPQSTADLTQTMTAAPFAGQLGFTVGGVNFPQSPAFAEIRTISGDPNHVSAALLYAALSKRSVQGTTFGSDEGSGKTGKVTLNGIPCDVYLDGWDNPIAFVRWYESAELNAHPYTNAKTGLMNQFDPRGRLAGWTNTVNRPAAQTVLGVTFSNANQKIVVYSAGTNGQYENLGGDDVLSFRVKAEKKGTP